MKRVALLACPVGRRSNSYDFLIYGTAAALVCPTVFFPHLDPTVAAVASMGTFAVAGSIPAVRRRLWILWRPPRPQEDTLVATLLIAAWQP